MIPTTAAEAITTTAVTLLINMADITVTTPCQYGTLGRNKTSTEGVTSLGKAVTDTDTDAKTDNQRK